MGLAKRQATVIMNGAAQAARVNKVQTTKDGPAKMSDNHQKQAATDPFTQFWGDMFARMGTAGPAAGASPSGQPSAEATRQMQRVFFDAMAKFCDDYMRSEQFLSMLKETMDRSLAFKQQVDLFLTNLYRGAQMPARADVDDISDILRSIEKNVLDRLADLDERVAAVEDARRTGRAGKVPRAPRPTRMKRRRAAR